MRAGPIVTMLLLVTWSRGALAGDRRGWLIYDEQCPRETLSNRSAWMHTIVPLAEVTQDIRDYFGTRNAKRGVAAGLGYDRTNHFCSEREQQAVLVALLAAIEQPEFFHQQDFLDIVQVQGSQRWLGRFEEVLTRNELPEYVRLRAEKAAAVLRKKYP